MESDDRNSLVFITALYFFSHTVCIYLVERESISGETILKKIFDILLLEYYG